MFGIGSTSKMLATVAVMQLVEQGVVSLDEPLVRYVPLFRMADPRYGAVTVRMLLNHASGLPGANYRNIFTYRARAGYADSVLAALSLERMKATPGFMNVYCNDGFTLVEVLVKAVTGQDYATFLQAAVLDPLGMTHSAFTAAPFPEASYAKVYRAGAAQPQEFVGARASGGLYTTPSDLATFARMFLNGGAVGSTRILTPSSIEAMAVDQTLGTFNPVKWNTFANGLGWDTVEEPGLHAAGIRGWSKGGDTEFYGAEMMIAPAEGLAVVVMGTQGKGYDHGAAAQRILLQALIETGKIASFPPPVAPVAKRVATAPDALLSNIAGYYANYENLYQLRVEPNGSLSILKLGTSEFALSDAGLKYRSDGWFTSDADSLSSFKVVETKEGSYLATRVPMGARHYLSELAAAQKLPTTMAALSPIWRTRAGLTWLIVNESPDSQHLRPDTNPRFTITTLAQLPGLLIARPALGSSPQIIDPSASETVARMMLTIPGATGRDLNDLDIVMVDGEEWVRWSDWIHRPAATVPVLPAGSRTGVTIGAPGYAEWRAVQAGETPLAISVSGAGATRFYDREFKPLGDRDPGESATIPPGSGLAYVTLFGNPGDRIEVSIARS